MKKIYTLFYSLNNIEKDENYAMELSEIEENEQLLEETLKHFDFSPRKETLDNILKHAMKA